jgi:SHS2 domain-containing protein
MGFDEIPHTADWSIRVWADDVEALLVESARGMYWLSGAEMAATPRVTKTLVTEEPDDESLLIAFLSELVYFTEQENLAFDVFDLSIKNGRLKVEMEGAPLKSISKTIKAVTWHNLEISKSARGLEVEIVFDV